MEKSLNEKLLIARQLLYVYLFARLFAYNFCGRIANYYVNIHQSTPYEYTVHYSTYAPQF